MSLPPPKICQRARKLFAQMGSSGKDAEVAREMLNKLIQELGLTWNDLPGILAADIDLAGTLDDVENGDAGPAATQPTAEDIPDLLGLVLALLEEYASTTAEQRLAIALWILHCWVFDQFVITPRLALLSPVRGCGKTTLLALIELLIPEGNRTDHTTAAAIYYDLAHRPRTVLLVDEADGLDLCHDNVLRTVFNSGHRRGGSINRFVGGEPRRYRTFAPLAIAAIGTLPLPLLHRSVVISMQRSSAQLRRLDETSHVFNLARQGIQKWSASVQLVHDPEMPPALRNRTADNWRILISVADSLGYGEEARAAAVALSSERPDEDAGVVLLTDIRIIFQARKVDRIGSAALIEELVELGDGRWAEFRGVNDDRPPRKLTQPQLAQLLRPFGIGSRTIWPLQRKPGDKSSRGYLQLQFELAWRAYCFTADTPTQPSNIMTLWDRELSH